MADKEYQMIKKKTGTEPELFGRIWNGWKKVARKIGDFNARVILTVFYIVVLSPFALMLKIFTDPLNIKKGSDKKGWRLREDKDDLTPMERSQRQF